MEHTNKARENNYLRIGKSLGRTGTGNWGLLSQNIYFWNIDFFEKKIVFSASTLYTWAATATRQACVENYSLMI